MKIKTWIWLPLNIAFTGIVLLACADRHKMSFTPRDDQRAAYIEMAKTDPYVDLGELGIKDERAQILPIPKKDIPSYASTHSKIYVIRWITDDEYNNIIGKQAK